MASSYSKQKVNKNYSQFFDDDDDVDRYSSDGSDLSLPGDVGNLTDSSDEHSDSDNESGEDQTDSDGSDSSDVSAAGDARPRDQDWTEDLDGLGLHPDFAYPHGPTVVNIDYLPIDYFHLLFNEEFYDRIMDQTNLYARQNPRRNEHWEPLTDVREVKAYLAIQLYMGIVKLNCTTDYWSSDPLLNQPFVSNLIVKNRFKELNKNFHVADNTLNPPKGRPGHDPLGRVRPILDMISLSFPGNFNPRQNMCIDEGMIKFKGRCPFLQYLPAKPTKWGIKAWAVCDSHSLYMLNFNIYTGKFNDLGNGDRPLGDRVVLGLMGPYLDKHHVVYFDNYFSSLPLFETLFQRDTYACGTVRSNRKGWPAYFKQKKCVKKPGDTLVRRKNSVQAIAWYDRKKVLVASTAHDSSTVEKTRRARPGTEPLTYPRPTAIAQYSLNYFGVDKHDQLRQYYSCASRAHKYWKYIFWFVVDCCAVNAWILYKMMPLGPRRKPLSHKAFMLSIIRALAGDFVGRKRIGRPLKRPSGHSLTRIATKRGCRDCVQCKKDGMKTKSNHAIQSRLECLACTYALCKACFTKLHP